MHKRIVFTALAAALVALFLAIPHAQAHSIRAVSYESGALVVEVSFGGGEIASYAQVTIMAPNSQQEFQSGVTDAHGRFAFLPDQPGNWRVIIDAGMGHKTTLSIEVPDAVY